MTGEINFKRLNSEMKERSRQRDRCRYEQRKAPDQKGTKKTHRKTQKAIKMKIKTETL